MILDQDGAARKRLAQVLADGEPDDAAFEADLFSYVTNTASLELRANIESAMERSRSLCELVHEYQEAFGAYAGPEGQQRLRDFWQRFEESWKSDVTAQVGQPQGQITWQILLSLLIKRPQPQLAYRGSGVDPPRRPRIGICGLHPIRL